MKEYHKINTIFKRDERGEILVGQFSQPEFEYLAGNKWSFTEKIDGTNIRVVWDGETITFGGKTDNAQIPAFLFKRLQELFPVDKFKELPPLCLYGEGYGARIQKGGGNYISNGVDFILFDILIDKWWLKKEDICDISNKLNIRTVPDIGSGTLMDAVELARSGFTSEFGNFIAEGIVLRPEVGLFNRSGQRIITKIKHKDFRSR
jgi:ATP-dependent RNA circularization protein (DNA/RNA ligase family)